MGSLPIIYVRGYAGTQGEVEGTVDDPFYGFNKGATHVRVGPQGEAKFFAFESPLVRLMTEHGYRDVYEGDIQSANRQLQGDLRKTIWIYRYYDDTSQTFDGNRRPKRLSIEDAARGLKALIEQVIYQCDCDKVNLIAHSMGGLICRCLIQKIYPEEGNGKNAVDAIDKLFTFGTPHGGIHFDVPGGGLAEWIRDRIGWNNSDDFGMDRMYEYLVPGALKPKLDKKNGFDPRVVYGGFPVERIFCIVGTNAKDYDVAAGMSRRTVGPQSDGLVQIESAYVKGSNRAYIHRSHSGRYGMVNSEEGYQNLRRFLFGHLRVAVSLEDISLPTDGGSFRQAEVAVAIRGLPMLVHERTTAHFCPILLCDGEQQCKDRHHLYTFFLMPRETGVPNVQSARYSLQLTLYEFKKSDSFFDFRDHLEQTPLWNDHMIVEITFDATGGNRHHTAQYIWKSEGQEPKKPILLNEKGEALIDLPDSIQPTLGASGNHAKLCLQVSQWG